MLIYIKMFFFLRTLTLSKVDVADPKECTQRLNNSNSVNFSTDFEPLKLATADFAKTRKKIKNYEKKINIWR